jgi:hypothetical protein
MLPPLARRRHAPPLKSTNSFLFTGLHPLYRREVIHDQHDYIKIYYNQPGCTDFEPRVINRTLSSTNNYKPHYRKYHPDIPLLIGEVAARRKAQQDKINKGFYIKPEEQQTHDEQYRTLLLEFIIKNNLSFCIVDQPKTKALFIFLSPKTKQCLTKTLIKDLKTRYKIAEEEIHKKLQAYINSGRRIALTTNK